MERRKKVEANPPPPLWRPHPANNPQVEAFFSEAFEILYGGAAGGGKSDLLLGLARTEHRRSLLLRRTFPDLERSLISRSIEFFGPIERYNGSKHVWQIDGRRIEFGHMEHIGTPQIPGDEASYASAPYDFIAFDQLEQFSQYAYEFMISRARTTVAEPGQKQQRVRMLSSANPVGENIDWIIRRWAPWLDETYPNPAKSGEIRWFKRDELGRDVECSREDPDAMSRTFIAAGLKDNPYLGDDYRKRLNLLPEPLRSALMNGDWKASITDDAYQVIPRAWVKLAMSRWKPGPPMSKIIGVTGAVTEQVTPMSSVGADIARGGADKTVLAPRYGDWFDQLRKYPGYQTPDGQAVVTLIVGILPPGEKVPVNMDVIGIGASAYDIGKSKFKAIPVNFAERSTFTDVSGQLEFTNLRAECYWKMREALDPNGPRQLALPDDPELLGDLVAPRWSMQTNGIRIESKEDIKDRIERSPDCGDAVVLALYTSPLPTLDDWVAALKKRTENRS